MQRPGAPFAAAMLSVALPALVVGWAAGPPSGREPGREVDRTPPVQVLLLPAPPPP